MTNDMFLNLPF